MRHLTACICMLILLGSASGQTKQSPTRPTPAVVIAPVGSGAKLDPVTLTRASLDEKVITLRLSPRVATSIRMPEPVNSVVIGDPERFQAEHSEHEPELVTVKPVSAAPAQTNLLITTTLGHQLNLLLISSGQQSGGTQTVDVLLKYGKPTGEASSSRRVLFLHHWSLKRRSLMSQASRPSWRRLVHRRRH
jgi:hypothetical protein